MLCNGTRNSKQALVELAECWLWAIEWKSSSFLRDSDYHINRVAIRKSGISKTLSPIKSEVLLQAVAEADGQGCGHSLVGRWSCLVHCSAFQLDYALCPCDSGTLVLILTRWLGLVFEIQACPGQTGLYVHPTYKIVITDNRCKILKLKRGFFRTAGDFLKNIPYSNLLEFLFSLFFTWPTLCRRDWKMIQKKDKGICVSCSNTLQLLLI